MKHFLTIISLRASLEPTDGAHVTAAYFTIVPNAPLSGNRFKELTVNSFEGIATTDFCFRKELDQNAIVLHKNHLVIVARHVKTMRMV